MYTNNQLVNSPYASGLVSMDQKFSDFRQLSVYSKEAVTNVKQFIDDNTMNEKKELEAALKKYRSKIERLENDPYIKQNIDLLDTYRKQQSITLDETNRAFMKMIQAIKNSNMSPEEQDKAIDEAGDYIMSQLMTEEELQEFQTIMSNVMIIVPNKNTQTSSARYALKNASVPQNASVSYS